MRSALTTEAMEGIKEVTEAANECAEALEKLEKVMGRLTNKKDSLFIEVPVILNGKAIAKKLVSLLKLKKGFN
ncbi:hypothetical protein NHG52_15470, partial [Bacillus thuringiensis]|uniref:hypothetical protein n=1 Tax=Bacillus thuringiensis TaxID=1428 RepID=UPI0021588619